MGALAAILFMVGAVIMIIGAISLRHKVMRIKD
jgi:hypothetical protein